MDEQGARGARLRGDRAHLDLVRASFDATTAYVLVVDAAGIPVLANPALIGATGWTVDELTARPFWETLVAPEDVAGAQDHVHRAITLGEVHPQEGDWLGRDGRRRRVWSHNSVVRDADGAPWAVVTVGVDVTDQRRSEADLRRRADTDPLTGLGNRGAFFERLGSVLADPVAGGSGVLFADLDGFKAANDRHGHHVGDQVLVEVAARLRRTTGADDVVARLGGDEFVVLRPGGVGLERLAELVRLELAIPVETSCGPVAIGVSVGIARGAARSDPDALVRAADHHMYRGKLARRRAGVPA
ncbi:sensor domain-containing diguanylate cyclase [uncultured Cellulomonas sp.]|uniref:sensor domain-containing diguanylate cyclase n=1 Tax=uncultured Cellulomonas sp. TaxID=189682 RepID=UPI002623C605|nr:sensor domain-containing diguanylate cyclase [uncultured Cellulomonas sp.]